MSDKEQTSKSSVVDELKLLNNQVRAKIVSDALRKGLIGALTGAAFSFVIFKRKLGPVWLGLGVGLGMAYSDGSQLIRSAHDSILEKSLNQYNSESEAEKKRSPNTVNDEIRK